MCDNEEKKSTLLLFICCGDEIRNVHCISNGAIRTFITKMIIWFFTGRILISHFVYEVHDENIVGTMEMQ